MAEVTDYYELLGVPETASTDTIKKAFRARALTSHPDHNPGDPSAENRFKLIQRAYHVLSDSRLREAYDQARVLSFGGARSWLSDDRPPAGYRVSDDFDPLASLFFGDARETPDHGADAEAQVRLTFDQSLRGGTTEVQLANGESARLTVPKGVRSGLKVRIKGRGQAGSSGHRGDLYVTFRVEPSTRYRREGDNLHVIETVSAIEAIVGTRRSITSAYGHTIKVHIPPGTQPGERLRLRGQGVETPARRGDLFVEVQVTVPRQLTDEQREALSEAAKQAGLL
jgi:molecular chaperone DnaJ/curved DNA-binding protein